MTNTSTIKLAAFLARSGVAARRKAEELILKGQVRVNGELEKNVARRVNPDKDVVAYKGQVFTPTQEKVLLMLHKQKGIVSSVSDPQGKPVVVNFIPKKFQHLRLFPVGRLDEDTEGLILLTNDGAYSQRLTHPKYEIPKTYRVTIAGQLTGNEMSRLRSGLKLKDFRAKPAHVEIEDESEGRQVLLLTIREGKYHEVRRMMKALNHSVFRLVRLSMGPFELGDLRPGQTREVGFVDLDTWVPDEPVADTEEE